MQFRIIIFTLLMWCVSKATCAESKALSNVILSYITMLEKPTSVLAPALCWSKYETTTLAKSLNEAGVNVAQLLQPNRTEEHLQHLLVVADFMCPDTIAFLNKTNELGMFRSPWRWILLNWEESRADAMKHLDVLTDSEVVVVQKHRGMYYIYETFKMATNWETTLTLRAVWSSTNPTNATSIENSNQPNGAIVDLLPIQPLSARRNNLLGHPLTMVNVVTDSNDTRFHLNDRLFLHHDSIAKMSYAVVTICFEMLNATEKLLFTHTWGYKDKNGNWQGLMDDLPKKKGDLGTLTIFTKERLKRIDYIAMVGTTSVRFVLREPPLAYVSNIFILPFTGAVWVAILICVLSCALFIYIASKWEATMGMHPLQLDGSWKDVLILIIGAVLQQGCTIEPRYSAGRCVTLLLFICLTILYSAYSANIVVLLRAPSPSIRSLQDLLNSPLKLGASDFEYNRYFFQQLNDPVRKSIYDKKIAPKGKKPNFYNMTEGVEKIRMGLFAFHMELNPGYRLIQETYQEHEKCDLVEIDYINEMDPWLPAQKRSPYKELLKVNFMKIRESGIQDCIHHRLNVPRPRCMGAVTTFSSVGITDMYAALIGTLYGAVFAPLILIIEIGYERLCRRFPAV